MRRRRSPRLAVVALVALAVVELVQPAVYDEEDEEWNDDMASEERNADDTLWPEPDKHDMNVVRTSYPHTVVGFDSEGYKSPVKTPSPVHAAKAVGWWVRVMGVERRDFEKRTVNCRRCNVGGRSSTRSASRGRPPKEASTPARRALPPGESCCVTRWCAGW
jgi:hypothetical protein